MPGGGFGGLPGELGQGKGVIILMTNIYFALIFWVLCILFIHICSQKLGKVGTF